MYKRIVEENLHKSCRLMKINVIKNRRRNFVPYRATYVCVPYLLHLSSLPSLLPCVWVPFPLLFCSLPFAVPYPFAFELPTDPCPLCFCSLPYPFRLGSLQSPILYPLYLGSRHISFVSSNVASSGEIREC